MNGVKNDKIKLSRQAEDPHRLTSRFSYLLSSNEVSPEKLDGQAWVAEVASSSSIALSMAQAPPALLTAEE